jgi:hypothetical protein
VTGEYSLGFSAFGSVDFQIDFIVFNSTFDDFGIEFEFEALFGEHLLKLLSHFGVHASADRRKKFDDSDIRAKSTPNRSLLSTHSTG